MKKLALTILLSLVVILSGCLAKPQGGNNVNQNINQNTNMTTTTGDIDISNWQTYKNEEYGFEIKYPSDWIFQESREGNKVWEKDVVKPVRSVSFGTLGSKQGGYIWIVEFYRKPSELENDIALIGNQFSDRKEIRKNIKINNYDALLVTVTTNTYEDWISESVYLNKGDRLFVIKNGAIEDVRFKGFYKSFRFIQIDNL